MSRPSLRDSLLASLSAVANPTDLTLTALSSAPRRTTSLFPHAPTSAARCHETLYLVTLSAAVPLPTAPTTAAPASAAVPAAPVPTSAPVLTSAISAHLYTVSAPSSHASPTSILYISKLDSSGYAPAGPSLTRELALALLAYFLQRAPGRLVVTLFARSQTQYLFPDSGKGGSKKVLGGLGLCGWWKGVLEEAVRRYEAGAAGAAGSTAATAAGAVDGGPAADGDGETQRIELSYVLPSYSAAEAAGMLGPLRKPLPLGVGWTYAPPFATPAFEPPAAAAATAAGSLALLIPSLPDDPKTRFLDEIVYGSLDAHAHVPAPAASTASASTSRPAADGGAAAEPRKKRTRKERTAAEDDDERRRACAALARVGAAEFWERMGFRQECISGDVTGFFGLVRPAPTRPRPASAPEGSTREPADGGGADGHTAAGQAPAPAAPARQLPAALLERLLASLLNTDFSALASAVAQSALWTSQAAAIVEGELGPGGWDACRADVPAKQGVSVGVKRQAEAVTVLQVRKKKRA